MKTPKQIKDDIYRALSGSRLVAECEDAGGALMRNERAADARTQDVVISIPANRNAGGDMQEAVVYVRVYIADVRHGNRLELDETKSGPLEELANEALLVINGGDFRATLDEMTTLKVEGLDMHAIVCRLLYRQNNN